MALITQVGTSTLSNQNLTTALLVHTFTNTSRIRKLYINIFIDQVAGNGDYIAHITVQRAGAGSAYTSIKTTLALASAVTSGFFSSIPLVINATDVVKVYVIGLAGDTATPDIIVDVNEEWQSTDASGQVAVGSIANDAITAAVIATGAVDADALAADGANEIADALLDRSAGIETGYTPRQALRIILAALGGKLSGAATTTVAIRSATDAKDRITATVDAHGNRSAVTLDGT